VRQELDAWEAGARHRCAAGRLQRPLQHLVRAAGIGTGFDEDGRALSYLLAHILPVPVMLLAANRRSTGIGVRPRGDRIEVTADFTPDAPLMIATATLIVGIVREVMRWPSYEIGVLDETIFR